MNPISQPSTNTLFFHASSQPKHLEKKVSQTAENVISSLRLETFEQQSSDLSDLLLREWEIEFQEILDKGYKILLTVQKEFNEMISQKDKDEGFLDLTLEFSEICLSSFEFVPTNEGRLPCQSASLEINLNTHTNRNFTFLETLEMGQVTRSTAESGYNISPSQIDTDVSLEPLATFEFLPTHDEPSSNQSAFLELNLNNTEPGKKAYHAYYIKHQEMIKARKKVYYQKNIDWIKARKAAHYQKNKERIKARRVAYYQKNKERIKARRVDNSKISIRKNNLDGIEGRN